MRFLWIYWYQCKTTLTSAIVGSILPGMETELACPMRKSVALRASESKAWLILDCGHIQVVFRPVGAAVAWPPPVGWERLCQGCAEDCSRVLEQEGLLPGDRVAVTHG